MKILFYINQVLWANHYDYILELMQRHLDSGDNVVQIVCNSQIKHCEINPNTDYQTCINCISHRIKGMNLISGKLKTIVMPDQSLSNEINYENKIDTYEDIKKIFIKNYDIGYAALSSIISLLRDNHFDLIKYKNMLLGFLKSGEYSYTAFCDIILREKPDLAYTFNGRLVHSRSFLRACQSLNINIKLIERGSDLSKFVLYENTLPHDLSYTIHKINENWERVDISENEKNHIASKFYNTKRNGQSSNWFSFVTGQKLNKLPDNWDEQKSNFIIFISSEDECAAIGKEWEGGLFGNQIEGLTVLSAMINQLSNSKRIHLFVRMHPNLIGIENDFTSSIYKLEDENISIISPNSDISTYSLIDNATKIITFASTTGVEATYWGKPSILLGKTFYRDLNCTYNPNNREELYTLLEKDLAPMPKEGSIKYGFYFGSFGERFKYFTPLGVLSGRFKNVEIKTIEESFKMRFIRKAYSLFKLKLLNHII